MVKIVRAVCRGGETAPILDCRSRVLREYRPIQEESHVIKKILLSSALLMAMSASFAGPVNINKADEKQLAKELTGVGPSRAAAIVQFRTEKGPFKAPEDLKKVPGVGAVVYKNNATNIKVTD